MAVDFNVLASESNTFFKLHWPHPQWGAKPEWRERWEFRGTMFGGERQGVYALMNANDGVLYVGVGSSLGAGLYEDHGLNSRT